MTPEAAIALVECFWEEVWAARNPSAVDRFVTEDFVITSAGVDVAGRENFKAWVADFQPKIAELKMETIETFANADGSRVRRASHHRPQHGMFGLPADGKPVAFTGNAILAVTPTGKIAPTGSSAAPGSFSTSYGIGAGRPGEPGLPGADVGIGLGA